MRESPVASEKIAVDLASRRPERSSTRASIWRTPSGTILPPANCGPFHTNAEHPTTEEAGPDRRQAAAREPALPLDREDAREAARGCGEGRRQGPRRRRP